MNFTEYPPKWVDKLVRDGKEDSEDHDMINQSDGADPNGEVDNHPSTDDTPNNGEDISVDPQRNRTPCRL